MRRVFLVVVATVLVSNPYVQLNLYVWLSWLTIFYYISIQPFETKQMNIQELVNEVIVLLVGLLA